MSTEVINYLKNNSVPQKGIELLKFAFGQECSPFDNLKLYYQKQFDDKQIKIINYLIQEMYTHQDWFVDTKISLNRLLHFSLNYWVETNDNFLLVKTIKFIKCAKINSNINSPHLNILINKNFDEFIVDYCQGYLKSPGMFYANWFKHFKPFYDHIMYKREEEQRKKIKSL